MFDKDVWSDGDGLTDDPTKKDELSISDVDTRVIGVKSSLKFISTFVISVGFFLFPITVNGQTTTPLDASVSYITANFPFLVELFILGLLLQLTIVLNLPALRLIQQSKQHGNLDASTG
ncbi:hypothetical protein [Halostagnicola sp. A56]|uniref:hypothetical protein n=1 Tax=Halostagnicola sp. A56 TaxID=1495067 RepID=UPI0012E2C4BE|nr:hypothetical protein [Halostagnicola sp. A56]